MPVKLKIDYRLVQAKVNASVNGGMGLLANEILNDCNQYCKEDTGMLIASSLIHSKLSDGKLIWQTPYARRQYWEIRTAYTDVNSNATWKWCEVAKARHKDQWERQAQKLMGGNA